MELSMSINTENFKYYSKQLQEVILNDAYLLAKEHSNQEITVYHFLWSVLKNDNIITYILKNRGVSIVGTSTACLNKVESLPSNLNNSHSPVFNRDIIDMFNCCWRNFENNQKKEGVISTGMMFAAFLETRQRDFPFAFHIKSNEFLTQYNLMIKEQIGSNINDASKLNATENDNEIPYGLNSESIDFLFKYTVDLTKLARDKKIDPVIGRNKEIQRIIQILQRKNKNNPMLLGESGVGKTAVAEGLAISIVNGDVPIELQNVQLLSLNITNLKAGTGLRGEPQERMIKVIQAIETMKKHGKKVILFIDEIHTLIDKQVGENFDFGNVLKPALSRGTLSIIGATTFKEYKQSFGKDPAMGRRFQTVEILEPSVEAAIAILRGSKEIYENHHGITIDDSAIVAAVKLSQKYITERFLPDKAFDLLDEATSTVKMELSGKPQNLIDLEQQISNLKTEKIHIATQNKESAKQRVKEIDNLLTKLEMEFAEKNTEWANEKSDYSLLATLKNELSELRKQAEKAEINGDLDLLSKINYVDIPKVELELHEQERKAVNGNTRISVDEIAVAKTLSQQTGIPVEKMMSGNSNKRLLDMPNELRKRVVGQDEALLAISNAIKRNRVGLSDPNKPTGSFLFLGPTGVGKTELCKALAEFLFDDEHNIVRMDMSEFMDSSAFSKLIGASAGFVGYEDGGLLTEKVKKRPYSVVLFDEIEKAHPNILNLLLQILDEGHITNGQGERINFKNTIVILTSNIGATHLMDDEYSKEEAKELVMADVKSTLRPELLNRIDDVLIFNPLYEEQLRDVVRYQLNRVVSRAKQEYNGHLILEYGESVVDFILEQGMLENQNENFGARPIKRAVQQHFENPLSDVLLDNGITLDMSEFKTIAAIHNDGKIKFQVVDDI